MDSNPPPEIVNTPPHYRRGGIEAINVIEAWGLGYHLGNALKYIARSGHKDPSAWRIDIQKAIWYLERYIETRDQQEGEL